MQFCLKILLSHREMVDTLRSRFNLLRWFI